MQLMIRRRRAKNVTLEAKIADLKEKMEPLKTNSEYMEKSKVLQAQLTYTSTMVKLKIKN